MSKSHRFIFKCLTVATAITIAVAIGITLWGFVSQAASTSSLFWRDSVYSIVSLVVAFMALGFSIFTFHSIDKVNKMASAEGNVLEDENYSIAYYADIARFKDAVDEESYAAAVLRSIEGKESIDYGLVALCDSTQ